MAIQQQLDLAVEHFNAERVEEAGQVCREILARDPNLVLALRILGVAERKAGQLEESLTHLQRAVALMPHSGLLHFEIGNTLVAQLRHEEAYAKFLKTIELKPNFAAGYINLCAVAEQQERFTEAIEWAKKAIACDPTQPLAHYNAANVYRETARFDEAIAEYELALHHNPGYAKASWNLGLCHLLVGHYQKGWELFETREAAEEVYLDRYSEPRWNGTSLQDKTVCVHAEQGIGDEIIFASCFPDLIVQAKRVLLVCEPRLESIFKRSFPQAGVYPWARRKDWSAPQLPEPFDVQVPAGSLPLYLRKSRESFPQREQFLIPDTGLREQWRDRFHALGPGLKVGISWRAGGKPAERRRRTIPLVQWRELLLLPGIQWINLQYSDATSEIEAIRDELGVTIHDVWDAGDPLVNMDDYAAKIAALDLVISVGNATVHTAGALGTEAWTLLPQIPSWRWMAHGDYSPWYTSVRLFRQKVRGDWFPVFKEIVPLLHAKSGHQPLATDHQAESTSPPPPATNHQPWMTLGDICAKASQEHLPIWLAEGTAALEREDFATAEAKFRQILQLAPRHSRALFGLGMIAKLTGRTELAIRSLKRSLSAVEALPAHHLQLGSLLLQCGRLDEAEKSLRRAVELDPRMAAAHLELGRNFREDQRWPEAEQCFRAAIKLEPHTASPRVQLGRLFVEIGRLDAAAQAFQDALAEDPVELDALFELGVVRQRQGQPQAALRALQKVLAARPQHAETLHAIGMLLDEIGECDEALAHFDAALALRPDFANSHLARSTTLLQLGCFADGWLEYEWRWQAPGAPRPRNFFAQPMWHGESLTGKRLLIHGEQGIGDEVMFASCYPDAIAQAAQCVILCEPRLAKLYARSFPTAVVYGVSRGREHLWRPPGNLSVDFQIAAGSLPALLRKSLSDFPRQEQLLIAEDRKIAAFRDRFAQLGDGLKIGIAWRGGEKESDRRLRWTDLAHWQPLLRQGACQFISLERGNVRSDLQLAHECGAHIHSLAEVKPEGDLDEFSASVAALDLVISVGNANVHLAGALGVPVWCLLPRHGGWRWLTGRDDSSWYPSVRLFRQERSGDWSGLLKQVAEELSKFAGRATDPAPRRTMVRSGHWNAAARTGNIS